MVVDVDSQTLQYICVFVHACKRLRVCMRVRVCICVCVKNIPRCIVRKFSGNCVGPGSKSVHSSDNLCAHS